MAFTSAAICSPRRSSSKQVERRWVTSASSTSTLLGLQDSWKRRWESRSGCLAPVLRASCSDPLAARTCTRTRTTNTTPLSSAKWAPSTRRRLEARGGRRSMRSWWRRGRTCCWGGRSRPAPPSSPASPTTLSPRALCVSSWMRSQRLCASTSEAAPAPAQHPPSYKSSRLQITCSTHRCSFEATKKTTTTCATASFTRF
mmetsp:Transcript_51141/g.121137  ORF Transcript_51141/g.121137 Transcript_51141/m.121137 type:complete len:200 (+) Transcript_51141:770-1369(+)